MIIRAAKSLAGRAEQPHGYVRQVLRGLCDSLSNKEIARRLEISEPTVKVHAQSVFRKIGARNRTHAALIARQQGFS